MKVYLFIIILLVLSACTTNQADTSDAVPQKPTEKTEKKEQPKMPNLQEELLTEKDSTTKEEIGTFDFKNFTYPLPRGWQDIDSKELTLENGRRRMTEEKIGMEYVTTKFFDVTGDDKDEALVILKVQTGSITIPQIVYIYEWKDENPELLWYFRTGDRAAGGLKNIYADEGELVVELYGRDRYIFTQMETSKIVGDEEDLCCPTHWTKSRYKKEGKRFVLKGDRWTYSLEDKTAEPVKNMNEVKLKEERGS